MRIHEKGTLLISLAPECDDNYEIVLVEKVKSRENKGFYLIRIIAGFADDVGKTFSDPLHENKFAVLCEL